MQDDFYHSDEQQSPEETIALQADIIVYLTDILVGHGFDAEELFEAAIG